MTHLPEVRAAIVKAVPEKECPVIEQGNDCSPHTIRLADVLRAIDKVDSDYSVSAWGGFEKWISVPDKNDTFVLENLPWHKWNLAADSLDDQSPETIAFLHSILCV